MVGPGICWPSWLGANAQGRNCIRRVPRVCVPALSSVGRVVGAMLPFLTDQPLEIILSLVSNYFAKQEVARDGTGFG